MKRKKGILLLMLLAAALALGGCSAQLEERAATSLSDRPVPAPVAAPQGDSFADGEESVTLYFLSEDGQSLVPVVRRLAVDGGISLPHAALEALLAGPLEGEDGAWPDMGLPIVARSMEVSAGVAIVDLPARVRTLPQETLYALRLAIAKTLTEFSAVTHVNVLIGGREEGFDLGATLPVGTLSRLEDLDVGTRYDRLDDLRQTAAGFTQATTLYMPCADACCVVAQVHRIDYAAMSPIEYLYTLLEEMGSASGVPAPMLFINEMPEIVRTEQGAYRAIEIRFEPAIDEALAACGLTRGVYLAMLTHTLMGTVPGVEGLQIYVGDALITSLSAEETPDAQAISFTHAMATRDDFAHLIGSPVTVYVRAQDAPGKLEAAERVLAHDRQLQPRALLEAALSEGLIPGVGAQDILGVSVQGTDYAVNLSAAAGEALAALEPDMARTAVYAIVNTLTQEARTGRVAFFFGGEQMQASAGGLEMRGWFSRNPGMVVD